MGNPNWHPGPGVNWRANFENKGKVPNTDMSFGTDFAEWPSLTDYGDSITARDIIVDSSATPVIQGTGIAIPSVCLPFGANGTDPDGFYVIDNIHHKGNIKFGCQNATLSENHTFPMVGGPTDIIRTNGVSTFPAGPHTIWVGTTKITYQSRTTTELQFCVGGNSHKPFELGGVTISNPVKFKSRYYRLSNKTPDTVNVLNNDPNSGRFERFPRQGCILDMQHFHQLCPGAGPGVWEEAFNYTACHDGFVRNFYIESKLFDAGSRGFWSTDCRLWHGTVTSHQQSDQLANLYNAHLDGFQWSIFDDMGLRRQGLPTLKQIYFYGDNTNADIFTNAGGSAEADAYNAGFTADTILFGGKDWTTPGGSSGRPIHTGNKSYGARYIDCWMNRSDYAPLPNPVDTDWYNNYKMHGQKNNTQLVRMRYENGSYHEESSAAYESILSI